MESNKTYRIDELAELINTYIGESMQTLEDIGWEVHEVEMNLEMLLGRLARLLNGLNVMSLEFINANIEALFKGDELATEISKNFVAYITE